MYEEQRNEYGMVKAIEIEGAELIFPNFAGAEKSYGGQITNKEGDRNFGIRITNLNDAVLMYNDGWNIQVRAKNKDDRELLRGKNLLQKIDVLKDRGTLEDAIFFLKVNVDFGRVDKYKPTIKLAKVGSKKLVDIDEDTAYRLDADDILQFDCTIFAKPYKNPSREGITAMLKDAYVMVREAGYKAKYADYEED